MSLVQDGEDWNKKEGRRMTESIGRLGYETRHGLV